MKTPLKTIVGAAVAFSVLFSAGLSMAETFGSSTYPAPTTCTNISRDLFLGSRDYYGGGDVTKLQAFLQTRGYLSVSPSGYFGYMTMAGVRSFQASQGISPTGYVGPLTRAAIQRVSCNTVPPIPPTGTPVINSLSPSSGVIGTTVTINGSGFVGNNTVYFGGSTVNAVVSSNGQMLSFTVPEYITPCSPGMYCIMMARLVTPGTYDVRIINNNGTSNSVNFTVTGSTNTAPQISSLTPTSGAVGATVIVQGSGFAGNNTVHFGNGVVANVYSSNGTSLSFNVPERLDPACYFTNPPCMTFAASQLVTPGVYSVSVENSRGTSNSISFTVTGNTSQSLQINSLSPSSGVIGTTVTVNGTGFTGSNTIMFKGRSIGTVTSQSGQSLSFTVPSYLSPYCSTGMYCPAYVDFVTPGSYGVQIQNSNGLSNTLNFTVTSQSTGGPVSITGLNSPSQLRVGQQGTWTVQVQGDGNNLNYSVVWGDENMYGYQAAQSTASYNMQSSGTFTHTYYYPGNFNPRFTVTSGGSSATASASVVVLQ